MGINDTRTQKPPNFVGATRAVVASSATELTDMVDVVIPEFDPKQRWGPCKWMPRGDITTLPARGDDCIIIFDNERNIWIIGWWPI